MSTSSYSTEPIGESQQKPRFLLDKKGTITDTIGTGDNAKNSLIYVCIHWCFLAAALLTLFVVLNNWFFRQNEKVPDFVEDIRTVWMIFLPVVTLALGYAFGKSHK